MQALVLWIRLILAAGLQDAADVETEPGVGSEQDEEEEREAELFGGGDESEEESENADDGARGPGPSSESRDEAMLSASTSTEDIAERLMAAQDPLRIGGLVFLRYTYSALDEGRPQEFAVDSPNFLDLYLDARVSDDVRIFTRGRLRHDPSLAENQSSVALDQLWLKWSLDSSIFFTAGKQRIKWGTGRFWNPADFLNTEILDPLSVPIFDERLGVTLLKLHVPLEARGANLYAIASVEGADQAQEIGGALRGEYVLGTSELSATVVARRGQPIRMGADYSGALGPLDLRLEGAVQHGVKTPFYRGTLDTSPLRLDEFDLEGVPLEDTGAALGEQLPGVLASRQPSVLSREESFIPQLVVGAEYARNYSDDDAIYVGAEYFFNDLGYSSSALYPVLLQKGQFRPFYTGRHYAGLYVSLPSPGSWNDTILNASVLANLSDRSMLTRLDYSATVLTYLTLNAFLMGNMGSSGEFNYSYHQAPLVDPGLAMQLPADLLGELPAELLEGVDVTGPLLSIGVGLRSSF